MARRAAISADTPRTRKTFQLESVLCFCKKLCGSAAFPSPGPTGHRRPSTGRSPPEDGLTGSASRIFCFMPAEPASELASDNKMGGSIFGWVSYFVPRAASDYNRIRARRAHLLKPSAVSCQPSAGDPAERASSVFQSDSLLSRTQMLHYTQMRHKTGICVKRILTACPMPLAPCRMPFSHEKRADLRSALFVCLFPQSHAGSMVPLYFSAMNFLTESDW